MLSTPLLASLVHHVTTSNCPVRKDHTRPFRIKFFSLISEIKRNWFRFTCVSLFHYKISLLFFRFFSLIFASLHFSNFRFEVKQSEVKFKYIFSLFSLFFRFFHFFRFFLLFFTFFAVNFLLRFDLVIFASKRNKAKWNSSLFFRFFAFFHFFSFFGFFCFFSFNFCFALIFSLSFRLFYLRFRFRFLVFRIEVNHVKSGFISLPSETKFSLQFQISLSKGKWERTLHGTLYKPLLHISLYSV